jgi:hypothetical protein
MKISYNESDRSIEIRDGLKTHVLLIKVLMYLNLANSLLNLVDISTSNFGFIKLIWIFLGVVSVTVLYKFIFKKSTLENIPIDQIKGLSERIFLGRKKYFLQLQNGKMRDLLEIKTDVEFKELKKMFIKIGIKL